VALVTRDGKITEFVYSMPDSELMDKLDWLNRYLKEAGEKEPILIDLP